MNLAGCHATVLTPSPADALRQNVQDLQAKNSALEAQVEELQAQLAIRGETVSTLPDAQVEQATARVAKISIGSLSRALPKKKSGNNLAQPERVMIFVNAQDGRGDPIQLTGNLTLEASLQSAGTVVPLAVARWSPLQLRNAYRSGFGSPHYLLETPIQAPPTIVDATALVVVTYVDGWTGRTLKTERAIPWPIDDFQAEKQVEMKSVP